MSDVDSSSSSRARLPELYPNNPEVAEVTNCCPWVAVRNHDFSESAHVNLQETNELLFELRNVCNTSLVPERRVNGSDSSVLLLAREGDRDLT